MTLYGLSTHLSQTSHGLWFAYPRSWPSSNVSRSINVHSRRLFSCNALPHGLCSCRSRPCPSQMRRHTHVYGTSPDLSSLITTTARASPPSLSHPRSQVFMCFYTRTRVSIRHVHRFYQIVILRAPRSSRPVPPLFFSRRSLSAVSHNPISCVALSSASLDGLPVFLSILTQSLLGNFSAIVSLAHKHSLMTGVALVGRRWADRRCRDRTVTLSAFSPVQYP